MRLSAVVFSPTVRARLAVLLFFLAWFLGTAALSGGLKLGAEMRAKLWGPNLPRSSMPERIACYTNDHLFGDVWQDPALSTQEHSLLTCAVLVALVSAAVRSDLEHGGQSAEIGRNGVEG